MNHVLLHEGNDEADNLSNRHLRSLPPPLQHLLLSSVPSSSFTPAEMVALPTSSPLLRRNFQLERRKGHTDYSDKRCSLA
jgi:hypothetical protein